jgi:nucleoside-diphosphate-sugar epimerase
MNILVTGATGFLGSNMTRALTNAGHTVVAYVRENSSLARIASLVGQITLERIGHAPVLDLLQQHKINTILHCATNYGRGSTDEMELLEANLMLPLQMLHFCKEAGVRSFVNTDTILDKRVSKYSLSKSHFKDWLHHYSSDLTCINVALEHFYGPRDNPSKFVTYIIHSLLHNTKVIDLTFGEQRRDFIYIDDVVSALLKIIAVHVDSECGFASYEIASGCSIAIRDFVELARRIADNHTTLLNFGALDYRPNEVMETRVDMSAINSLGWSSHYTLEEGLTNTIREERKFL